jgi:hypothetical protein
MPTLLLSKIHQQFEAALPEIESVIRYHFRHLSGDRRQDAIANATAANRAAWHGLIRRGKDPLKVGVAGIAGRCCLFTKAGRKIGNTNRGRACLDVHDRRAYARIGLVVVSLDRDVAEGQGVRPGTWRNWLAESNRVSPGDEACFRIDFAEWLAGLPTRKREIAEQLLLGCETGEVARRFAVTPAAVSQTRTWLEASWTKFQVGDIGRNVVPVRRPRGRPRKEVDDTRQRKGRLSASRTIAKIP